MACRSNIRTNFHSFVFHSWFRPPIHSFIHMCELNMSMLPFVRLTTAKIVPTDVLLMQFEALGSKCTICCAEIEASKTTHESLAVVVST